MSMASAAPFSGLSRPANSAPVPAVADQAMRRVGTYGGRIASTGTTRRQALGLELPTRRPPPAAGSRRATLPQRRRHAWSGGRCTVCTTGAGTAVASRTAGASKA